MEVGVLRERMPCLSMVFLFFNDTATTEIYTLSLHDALPISDGAQLETGGDATPFSMSNLDLATDRKSTRLNSSHLGISYAVLCLKKNNHPRLGASSTAALADVLLAPTRHRLM